MPLFAASPFAYIPPERARFGGPVFYSRDIAEQLETLAAVIAYGRGVLCGAEPKASNNMLNFPRYIASLAELKSA